ncbi:hypothetical protein LSH36_2142g00003 [Paralvinella palmiformis]|uniref:Uncharacterized protein n=1 Tax=Paralvinella palmiformis TaxID=53620 RepID=A0AAD9MNW0_9ANNE|nr:hypothetical protein LSH36_2142g00003 [Paralvinella palmiformis]
MKQTIILMFVISFLCEVTDEQITCAPGVSQTFSWKFTYEHNRTYTFWKFHEDNIKETTIMKKIGDQKAVVNTGTGFENRISEDPNSNAGIVITDMKESDTGTYSVIVNFVAGFPFETNESISLSAEYGKYYVTANTEILNNAKIYINGTQLNTTGAQYIGEPELTFSFTVTGACVQTTDITIFFGDEQVKCTNDDACSLIIKQPVEVRCCCKRYAI